MLGFGGGLVVRGGLQIATGASANGKCPYPNDLDSTTDEGMHEYCNRIRLAIDLLRQYEQVRDAEGEFAAVARLTPRTGNLTDWIQHQSIQSSDLVAISCFIFRYMKHNPFAGPPSALHVCGPPSAAHNPPFPPSVFKDAGLEGNHLEPPPIQLWREGHPPR